MTLCIDIRCRPPHGQFLDYFNVMIAPEQRPRSFAAASMALWFDEMRQAGIAQAVAAGGINAGMRLGHRDIREIIAVCMRREHVFVAPDVYLRWPGTQDWVDAINFQGEIGQGRFEDHFIFGTAYPYMDLVSYMSFFNALPIRDAAKQKILRGNALRALRLDSQRYPDAWPT